LLREYSSQGETGQRRRQWNHVDPILIPHPRSWKRIILERKSRERVESWGIPLGWFPFKTPPFETPATCLLKEY